MSRAQARQQTEWFPCRFFSSERPAQPFALILLNQPLNWAAFESIAKSGMCIDMAPNSADTDVRDEHRLRFAPMGERTGFIKSLLGTASRALMWVF
jgi:hypothetical protein